MTLQQGIDLIESFIKQLQAIEKIALRKNDTERLDLTRAEIGDLNNILEALKHID